MSQNISEATGEVRSSDLTPNFALFTVSRVRFIPAKQQKSSQNNHTANFDQALAERVFSAVRHIAADLGPDRRMDVPWLNLRRVVAID